MRALLATSKPVRELPSNRYLCQRCGMERTKPSSRNVTGLCRDCYDVERRAS